MGFDTGLWDRLFGERITIEVPGPDGTRSIQVTKKWFEQKQREGHLTRVESEVVTAHIIDPFLGLATKLLVVGEDISSEEVATFRDTETDSVYLMIVYRDDEPETMLLRRDIWEGMKAKYDAIEGSESP